MTLTCILLMSYTIYAQNNKNKAVEIAVEQLRLAMIDRDTEKLANLTARALSYGHSNGVIENQATFISSLASGKYRFLDIKLTEQSIKIDKDVAIVRHKLFGITHDEGKTKGEIQLGILQIWQHLHGKWKLLARQAHKL